MPQGVKTELSLDAQEFIRTVLNIGTTMKNGKSEAEKFIDETNKALKTQEKQAKEVSKFLTQNIKDEKKRRSEVEKNARAINGFLNQNIRNEGKRRKEVLRTNKALEKRKKGLLEEVKIMKRLGQLSMATYAVGRMAGYAKAVADTVKEQEAMNLQMAVLEQKGKGWIDALKQAQVETKGLVKMHELLSAANMAESMKLGFKPEEFTDLAQQAQRIAVKLNEPFDVAFTKLMKGIGRGSKKLLDDLIPGFRDLELINADYAKVLGKETSELTEQDKIMARKMEVLKQIRGISEDVTDQIIDQNLRLTKQLNKLDIFFNKQKKMAVEGFTNLMEYSGAVTTMEQDADLRYATSQTRLKEAYLKAMKEKLDKDLEQTGITERKKADLVLEYMKKTSDKQLEYSNKHKKELETIQALIKVTAKMGLDTTVLQTKEQNLLNKALQAQVDAWETKVKWQKHSAKLIKDEFDKTYQIYLLSIEAQNRLRKDGSLRIKPLTRDELEAFSMRRGIGAEGGQTGIEQLVCPDGYVKVGLKCVPIKEKKKRGRAKTVKKPDYDAYVKAYALEVYGFDITSDIVGKEAEKKFLKIQAEALDGIDSGRKKLKGRMTNTGKFGEVGTDLGVRGLDADTISNMTKALNYQAEMRKKGIEIDRESAIKQIEIDNESAESQKKIRANINKDFLADKKDIFKQAKKMYNDDERNQLVQETEDLYNRRQVALALAGGTADELIAIETSKIKAMQELRKMDTELEKDYQKEKIAIQKSALEHMINISKELGNVAYEGLLRPASQAREQKELEMKIATINGATEEGLQEQQKLRDDFNARRDYEDSVWLDRAIGNALLTAGSQIYAQGITDLWKGGSDMFENPAKGALRMGYGALEVGVGLGLGYTGESMIPPAYQGRMEEDGQRDANNLSNLEDNQEIHAFMFPSQRQFQMATVKANKNQRY